MFYLGIDQHAKQLTINLRDADGDAILKRQVSTRPEKAIELFEQLTARSSNVGAVASVKNDAQSR